MSTKILESSALSAYCESIAMMLSAGIQTDEAVYLLGENMKDSDFKRACDAVYARLIEQKPFATAMAESGAFPQHVIDMVTVGEYSGRLESVLVSLSRYYEEEDRLFAKIKSALAYPAALLAIMSIILLFTVSTILPVFVSVYEGLTGNLTTGSYAYVQASIIIGWIAFGITFVCTLAVACGMFVGRTQKGRLKLMALLGKFPATKKPMEQLSLGRFTATLTTYIASGLNTETAMKQALDKVDHEALQKKITIAYEEMIDPMKMKALPQAIYDKGIYEPIYARMLVVGARSGSTESVLAYLSETFMDDSIMQIDRLIDSIEPTLAAFLTVSVGATLIAVMLPLIGIMGSIG